VLAANPVAFTPEQQDALCRHCELESIVISIENLKTFPFIQEALTEARLELHGAYFDLESGELYELDHQTRSFQSLSL
jgi:carbonic anhydrase